MDIKQKVFGPLETYPFLAWCGIANFPEQLIEIINTQEEYKELVSSGLTVGDIKERIETILWCDGYYDTEYRSHFEHSIVAYMLAIKHLGGSVPHLDLDGRWGYASTIVENINEYCKV